MAHAEAGGGLRAVGALGVPERRSEGRSKAAEGKNRMRPDAKARTDLMTTHDGLQNTHTVAMIPIVRTLILI